MRSLTRFIPFFLIAVLAACNLPQATPTATADVPATFTAAARTVEAQLTLIAPLATATPPPPPTATPLPSPTRTVPPPTATPLCDLARFIKDVTYPDGTVVSPGEKFTKTWRLRNEGTCTWTSAYQLVFDTGDQMGGAVSLPLKGTVAPGQEVDISIELTAPLDDGLYTGYWRLRNPAGVTIPVLMGYQSRSFFVQVRVKFVFAVTGVTFRVARDPAGSCAPGSKYVIQADITTNGAGTVTYQWVRSDGVPVPAETLTYSMLGTKTVSYEWATTDSGLGISLFISSPNNQTFGPQALNCP